jgi:preprotein translocase subunit SecE
MSTAAEQKSGHLDALKWLVVVLLLGGGIYANYSFAEQPLLYRVVGLVVVAGVAGAIAFATSQGASFYALLKGAQIEARRVVWPTRQERNQTTLVVVGFILVMALILWGLDSLFGWLTTLVLG